MQLTGCHNSAQLEQMLEQERLEKLRLLEQFRRLGVDVED
jgi:hypothetical protein